VACTTALNEPPDIAPMGCSASTGQLRLAQLNPQERSALAKHAAHIRWHPLQAKAHRERAEELARVVKQAIDDYLPSNKCKMMES
jgi:hypothetical protein